MIKSIVVGIKSFKSYLIVNDKSTELNFKETIKASMLGFFASEDDIIGTTEIVVILNGEIKTFELTRNYSDQIGWEINNLDDAIEHAKEADWTYITFELEPMLMAALKTYMNPITDAIIKIKGDRDLNEY